MLERCNLGDGLLGGIGLGSCRTGPDRIGGLPEADGWREMEACPGWDSNAWVFNVAEGY